VTAVLSTARQGRDLVDVELFGRLAARVTAEHPDVDHDRAERIVDQALAFLAAAAARPDERLSPSKLVDLGWHQLILSTKDYASLCDRLGGGFIHHVPDDARRFAGAWGVRRTIRAIEAAGYVVDRDLWPLKAKCGSCHEDGNCSNSGSDGNENSETRKKR
jgi:hypothetical protein